MSADDQNRTTFVCTACHRDRHFSHYHKRANGDRRLHRQCLDCQAARQKKRLANVVRDVPTRKRCTGCMRVKAAGAFSANIKRTDGLKAKCRDCCNAYATARRAAIKGRPRPKASSVILFCANRTCGAEIRLAPAEARNRRKSAKGGRVMCSYRCNWLVNGARQANQRRSGALVCETIAA